MKNRWVQVLSAVLVLLIFIAGMAKSILSPVDEIAYENRPAEKLVDFSLEAYSDQSFQTSMENSLADQVHMAIKAKKLYNIIDAGVALPIINRLVESTDNYVKYKDIYFYRDMLVQRPSAFSQSKAKMDYVLETLNSYQTSCPDTEFYAYYIESDRDLDFASGEKNAFYDYISSSLTFPEANISHLEISSFEDYHNYFLKTDHHWNSNGIYAAYNDICAMMQLLPLETAGKYTRENCYFGTRSAGIEGLNAEDFSIQLFDYPEMDMSYCGNPMYDYGCQNEFVSGELETVSYGKVFGVDGGEIVFTNSGAKGNLLIMGDSYDNPLLKPLASLFNTTHSVDLRAYVSDTGGDTFDMESFIAQNDIDKVLFIGTLEYFTGSSW